ncbi:MAG TPA: hypothetical protein VK640_08505 [Actinomycetes bacterium]|nr:hypothetical protein [Actinomycetes bacterium]
MSAPALTAATQDYLTAVERELADLPADDRSALLEDLALHLDALSGEDDDRPIAVRLGAPAAYAADLRAAAGLPPRPEGPAPAAVGLRERLARLPVSPAVREVRRLLRELRPAWWVLRGYLVVLVACLLEPDDVRDFPVPAPLGNPALGMLLVLAAVVGSVLLGRRTLPRPLAALVVVGGVVLAATSFVLGEGAWSRLADTTAYPPPLPDVPSERYPLLSRYGPVTDVFPYAADGTALEGMLLYDQDGRPLKVGLQEWWDDGCRRVLDQPLAADGVPVQNSYPQAYELAGQGGSCTEALSRPEVPLPVFPAAESVAPDPGD